jgi:hypothetical protein
LVPALFYWGIGVDLHNRFDGDTPRRAAWTAVKRSGVIDSALTILVKEKSCRNGIAKNSDDFELPENRSGENWRRYGKLIPKKYFDSIPLFGKANNPRQKASRLALVAFLCQYDRSK